MDHFKAFAFRVDEALFRLHCAVCLLDALHIVADEGGLVGQRHIDALLSCCNQFRDLTDELRNDLDATMAKSRSEKGAAES